MKLRHLLVLSTAVIVLSAPLSYGATHNWGTEGVSDTSMVDSIYQITNNPGHDNLGGETVQLQPESWDSQGNWIVYTAQIGGTGQTNYEICKIRPGGSGFTRLTNNSYEESNASFASDGNIYFGRDDGSSGIWRRKADGSGGETDLSAAHSATAAEYGPKVSPDASHYAYLSNSKLYVSQADGTGTQQQVSGAGVTVYEWSPYSFSWSPDSQWLVYVGSDGTGTWIYKVKADGSGHKVLSKPAIVPAGSNQHSWPTWSPDGTQIGYIDYHNIFINPTSTTLYKLRVIDPEGNVLQDTLDSTSYISSSTDFYDWRDIKGPITWSPDSKWLGYIKKFWDQNGTGSFQSIAIANTTDSSQKHTLTSGYFDNAPLWSPDGNQILFTDHSGYELSRDDSDDFGVATNFKRDLLLLNLGGTLRTSFPWPMYMPAIQGNLQE